MNQRELPQVPQGMYGTVQFLTLLLVAAMTGMVVVSARAGTRLSSTPTGSVPGTFGYLPSRGAPPLRFAAIIVPANPAPRLAVVDPSKPATTGTTQNGSTAHSADQPASGDVSMRPSPSTGTTRISSSPEKPAPLSIIPDEVRPQVRPEDFLPFFQIPGSGRNPDVTVLAPLPMGTTPPPQPSSATYIQTDK